MIFICEECGKKYQTKGALKKDKGMFICRSCGHIIMITKADAAADNEEDTATAGFQSVLLADPQEFQD